MGKTKGCLHCQKHFAQTRRSHIFCSDTCRKLAFKEKQQQEKSKRFLAKIEGKLKKLTSSSFGKYLIKEVMRAGTVEVLKGHTHETLKELVDLRRRCTAWGGFDNGVPLSTYELGHIWPVSNNEKLGLLHPSNLVITDKKFNRRHSKSFPTNKMGLSIHLAECKDIWSVKKGDSPKQIIDKCRKYLGKEFDLWLGSHTILQTQKTILIKRLIKSEIPKKRLLSLDLDGLKMLCQKEGVDYFSLTVFPKDPLDVLLAEFKRHDITGVLLDALKQIDHIDSSFDNLWTFIGSATQLKEYKDYLFEQAHKALHGQGYSAEWNDIPVLQVWKKCESTRAVSSWDDDDYYVL